MIQKLKDILNAARGEVIFKRRSRQIASQIDPLKIEHLVPTVKCNSKWYGKSYGGFFIHPDILTPSSIIYSFGIGTDITFDMACIKHHNCSVFAFDPTPKSINYVQRTKTPSKFVFHPFGISAYESGPFHFHLPETPHGTSGSMEQIDGVSKDRIIEVQMKTLQDTAAQLNHTHIDVLKMDIEGSEYDVLEAIMSLDLTINQIIVEFHDRAYNLDKYRSIETVAVLKSHGYEIFASSETFEEVSFIRTNLIN